MTTNKLISKGYFPKELPPSFHSELFGADCVRILTEVDSITNSKRSALIATVNTRTDLNSAQKTEERTRLKQIFKNRLAFSDPGIFNIPKHGISRNIIKVPNPFHQAKLAESISANYTHLQTHYDSSNFCVSKPFVETENGEGKRAIYHDNFGVFKEKSIIKSFNFAVELTTDISKFYPSIYTHIIPWVTFGGKEKYKKNRVLSPVDNLRVNNIYGDAIDSRQQWCQNQQTMGIPVGPDTSFLVAELIACHIDKLLEKKLKRKNIDFLGFRYYDDFRMYFHSELEAQIGLTELKNILNDFELKINDQKTKLSKSNSELEKEWALALRTFYFRPSEKDQKEDLWNFFSIAFSYATQFPDESVLKLALVKFNFVRIEESNWSFFESLIFRLGLQETSSLHQIGKLLVTYETLVNKTKLNKFCVEIIKRHYKNGHDYELTWALWLMNNFNIQPKKELFLKIFSSKSVFANIVAFDLLSQNNRIKTIDKTEIESLLKTENLNTKYWLLVYEIIYNAWTTSIPGTIITNHIFFEILKRDNINFYDNSRKLEPLKTEQSHFDKINRKLHQIDSFLASNLIVNTEINSELSELSDELEGSSVANRNDIRLRLTKSDQLIKSLILKIEKVKNEISEFEERRPYFVLGKRLEELDLLTSKEIVTESKQDKELLFDPKYK